MIIIIIIFINDLAKSMYESFQFYCYYFIRVFISITFFDLNGQEREGCTLYMVIITVLVFYGNKKKKKKKNMRISLAPLVSLLKFRMARRIECANDTTFQAQKKTFFFFVLSWSSHCDREMYEAAVK